MPIDLATVSDPADKAHRFVEDLQRLVSAVDASTVIGAYRLTRTRDGSDEVTLAATLPASVSDNSDPLQPTIDFSQVACLIILGMHTQAAVAEVARSRSKDADDEIATLRAAHKAQAEAIQRLSKQIDEAQAFHLVEIGRLESKLDIELDGVKALTGDLAAVEDTVKSLVQEVATVKNAVASIQQIPSALGGTVGATLYKLLRKLRDLGAVLWCVIVGALAQLAAVWLEPLSSKSPWYRWLIATLGTVAIAAQTLLATLLPAPTRPYLTPSPLTV